MQTLYTTRIEEQQLSAMMRLFSPSLIRELSKKGASPLFKRLINEVDSLRLVTADALVRDLFDAVFSFLKSKKYRHEYIYKAAITHKVLLGKHSLKTAVMLNEFRVCQCKADSVILNGTSTVYEIKSERDSLARLPNQIAAYRKVFARVNVIAAEKHIDSILEIVPSDVGVMLLSERYQISTIREAVDAVERTSTEAIFDVLQLTEVKKILKKYGMVVPQVPNTQMYGALKKKFITLDAVDAHNGMVEVLKETRSLLPLTNLIDSLPKSLQPSVVSTVMKKQDRLKLLEVMDTPINEVLEAKY